MIYMTFIRTQSGVTTVIGGVSILRLAGHIAIIIKVHFISSDCSTPHVGLGLENPKIRKPQNYKTLKFENPKIKKP